MSPWAGDGGGGGLDGSLEGSGAGRELPAPFLRFVRLFNAGRFWESHEALEDAWRETGSDFYHGLILYASAFVHADRANAHGIVAQLDKAERALRPYRPRHLGVDVERLLRHGDRCRRRVRAREKTGRNGPWTGTAPAPTLHVRAEAVRGDEPELSAGSV